MKVEESLNVTFDESPPPTKLSPLVDDDVGKEEAIRKNTKIVNTNTEEDESIEVDKIINIKESKNHLLDQVIGNLNQRTLRSQAQIIVIAMQEELNQFVANDVWELVPLPISQSVIGTKWVFRNKLDENGIVSRNKARLVAQGYNQQEGIDYDETYAPVARLESIRILLAIGCVNDFKLYKMDVKSAFLNGFINKEVYVAQPPGFIDFQKPNHVYKLKKALYGLKQAPKAWGVKLLLGSSNQQIEDIIFFNQSKYIKEMLKKFGLEDSKPTKTPMSMEIKLTKDDEADSVDSSKYQGTEIETIVYADSDHAGDYFDRKSTSGVCTFMGCCLTYWFAKKQTALAISTTEAEYVFAGKACQQALWMKQALIDYGIRLDDVLIMCDNKGAIDLSTKMPSEYQQDYKKTRAYAPKIYNDPNMSDALRDIYRTLESRYVHEGRTIDTSFYNDLSDDSVAKFTAIGFDCLLALDEQICPRESYRTLEKRIFHKGRIITPLFIAENNMLLYFQAIGLEPFLTLNEPICPRFVVEFYHSLEVKRNEELRPYIKFTLGQFSFKLTSSQLSRILQTPYTLATFYTSKWSLNSLDDHPNSNFFGPKHDLVKRNMTIPRTTQTQLQRDPNKLHLNEIRPELRGWELFFRENFFCSLGKRNKVNACTAYMLYYLTIKRKFNFTSMLIYRMEEVKNKQDSPMPFAMLLTRLYRYILQTNPQAVVSPARFTFHEHVMDPLHISRNPSKEKGKKTAYPSIISSSSSSCDDNEAPSFLEFYDELSDSEDLTKAQQEKRAMFKCLNCYVGTITKYLKNKK
ncbi:retrovirus-related pol polyprotein from transposon TNT 1-94 [Tanacetum coccineum]